MHFIVSFTADTFSVNAHMLGIIPIMWVELVISVLMIGFGIILIVGINHVCIGLVLYSSVTEITFVTLTIMLTCIRAGICWLYGFFTF